jgi:sugar/nucleoside kinase (ribokinase family)
VTVLVLGDANVDMEIRLPTGPGVTPHGNPDPRLLGGGSAANTAVALARLGVPCHFAGTVGDDVYGRFAADSLARAGVDVDLVEATAEAPTVMVIVVVPADGERLIYVWPPTGGAHGSLRAEAAVTAVRDAEWLHVSGICLRVPQSRAALLAAMEQAQSDGVPVSFDLNLRLENWGWDDGFRTVVQEAVERSDVVVGAATDEIAALAEIDDPVAAAMILAGDARLVVARLGSEGAFACSAGEVVRSDGFDVQVADTVGAGDAFNAGFIAARMAGGDVGEALRWGNAVGALTVSRPGARSVPTRGEVGAMLRESGTDEPW